MADPHRPQPPKRPIKPTPYIWPKETVAKWLENTMLNLMRAWHEDGATDCEDTAGYFQGTITWSRDKQGLQGVPMMQKAMRVTARHVMEIAKADAHYNAQDHPYMHDPKFEPTEWDQSLILPQELQTHRRNWETRQSAYAAEQRKYNEDYQRWEQEVQKYDQQKADIEARRARLERGPI